MRLARALAALAFVAALSAPFLAGATGGTEKVIRRHERIGASVQGRPIVAWEIGNPRAEEHVLVVGCIHGNECAAIPVSRGLVHGFLPRMVDLFVLPNLNPDGFAANTRQNGRGVDLNRNFPWHWRHMGHPWSVFYSGPHRLSEPEARAGRRFFLEHRPDITIWFHQHMDLVWDSGGDQRIQRCFARLSGLRLRHLPALAGSAHDWINHTFPDHTSIVVELPAGSLSHAAVRRYVVAVRRLARWDATRTSQTACPV
jgi:murein peptide amidase A